MTMRLVSFAVLAFSSSMVACQAETTDTSGTGADAIRDGDDNAVYPEATVIDMVRDGRHTTCAGTLIAPRVVLTAGHCVHGFGSWSVAVPGAQGEGREQITTDGLLWDWGSPECGERCLDIALLFLSTPVKLEKYPVLARAPVADGSTGVAVGRVADGRTLSGDTRISQPVMLRAQAEYYVSHGLFLEHGDSGGPLFRAGTHEIIAINAGIEREQTLSIFQRFEPEIPTILQLIEAHGGPGEAAPSTGSCHVGERRLAPGESFLDSDGCNTCTCRADGRVSCTERSCVPQSTGVGESGPTGEGGAGGSGTCVMDGRQLASGEKVPLGDGCNECTCRSNGAMSCTLRSCR